MVHKCIYECIVHECNCVGHEDVVHEHIVRYGYIIPTSGVQCSLISE